MMKVHQADRVKQPGVPALAREPYVWHLCFREFNVKKYSSVKTKKKTQTYFLDLFVSRTETRRS